MPGAHKDQKEAMDHSWLWVTTWVLGTEPGSSASAMLPTAEPSLQPLLDFSLIKRYQFSRDCPQKETTRKVRALSSKIS